jgi:general L-amino acid transport system substrate-binding protein
MEKSMMKISVAGASLIAALAFAGGASAQQGKTIEEIKARGNMTCTGHNGSYPGFAEVDDKGEWRGFDIDLCKAMTIALFGKSEGHLKVVPTSWAQRFPLIQSGELDVIIKSSGWTLGRDTNLQFTLPYLLIPTSILVHASTGATNAKELDGGTVCAPAGTTVERDVAEYAKAHNIKLETLPFEKVEEAKAAYLAERCDAFIDGEVQLAAFRANEAEDPTKHIIIDDPLGVEPVGMIMRQGDDKWVDVGNWVLSALWIAEANGITSENIDEKKANPSSPAVAKLLNAAPGMGGPLGLDDDWAYNVIKELGNYDQIFQRNLGSDSSYKLPRGVNSLVKDGGWQFGLKID